MIDFPGGLYGPGMHNYVLDEMELGARVALCQDSEDVGFGALVDLSYTEYMEAHSESDVVG